MKKIWLLYHHPFLPPKMDACVCRPKKKKKKLVTLSLVCCICEYYSNLMQRCISFNRWEPVASVHCVTHCEFCGRWNYWDRMCLILFRNCLCENNNLESDNFCSCFLGNLVKLKNAIFRILRKKKNILKFGLFEPWSRLYNKENLRTKRRRVVIFF